MTFSTLTANEALASLEDKLTATYQREQVYYFLKRTLILNLSIIIISFLIIVSGVFVNYDSFLRTIAFWGIITSYIILSLIISVIYIIKKGALKIFKNDFCTEKYSEKLEKLHSEIGDDLTFSLSIYKSLIRNQPENPQNKKIYYFSPLIAEYNLKKTAEKYKDKDFSSFIPFSFVKKLSIGLILVVLVISLSFIVFSKPLFSSINKFVNYNYEFTFDNESINFDVTPGNAKALKGSNLIITARLNSLDPNLIIEEIEFTTELLSPENQWITNKKVILKNNSNEKNTFTTVLENINTEIKYYFSYKNVKSQTFKISLLDFPSVTSLNIVVTPPEYTRIQKFTLENTDGNIICPEGSQVEFFIVSNKPLLSAGIEFLQRENNQTNTEKLNNFISFNTDKNTANGKIVVKQTTNYRFVLNDYDGSVNKENNILEIKVIYDLPPQIRIIEPAETEYSLKGEKSIILRTRISDDYGFNSLHLYYSILSNNSSASQIFNTIPIAIQNKEASIVEVPFLWYLPKLKSGQKIEYYFEVTDNSGKITKSERRYLKYISPIELLKNTEKYTGEIKQKLNSILEDIKNIENDIAELNKNIEKSEELGVNEALKKKELEEKVERIQQNLDALEKNLNQTLNELKQNNVLSEKTLKQFLELQEQFNKINTEEFREMLKKLQKALKNDNPKEFRDELRNINFDEEAFRKQLEEILKLMYKIENLQKFGDLTKQLNEITKKQQELKEQTKLADKNNQEESNKLSEKQTELKNDLNNFKNNLNNLLDNIKKTKDDLNTSDLERIKEKLESKKTSDKMNKSSQQLKEGNLKESEETQEDIMEDLNELNEEMMDALENALDTENFLMKMMNKLKGIKNDIAELSREQGELKDKTQAGNNFGELSNEQKTLKSKLSKNIDELFELTKDGLQIPPELGKELGEAYRRMELAEKNLTQSDRKQAIPNQEKAKESLDKTLEMLDNLLSQLEQQSKTGNKKGSSSRLSQLMERLAQLISLQQGINGQLQKLALDGNKGTDGRGRFDNDIQKKDQIEKLKLQQEQVKKSLEELNAEFEKERKKTGEKLLGDLKEVEKDMEQIIKDLSEYKIDQKTIERQNKILSRMLEFQLSQREKDFEQKRESRPGENVIRNSPPEIVISGPNSLNTLQEDFLRIKSEGYTEEFEKIILRYLELIK
ncbi:MAG: hypothetical protein N2490_02900 [Ignavibacteria bacterium]|nr:hypothetical protein [Ignavibacteria bacterium]